MTNAFLSPERIAAVALERLRRAIVLPRLVTRYGLADFAGAKNDTINIRVPALLTAREYEFRTRNNPIVMDELEELSIPIALDKHVYSAVPVTDEELTLDLVSFAQQVLEPQVIAVAEKLESYIAAVMENATYEAADISYVEDPGAGTANFYRACVDARKALNDAHVPLSGRAIIVGSAVEAAALKEDSFRKVDESGSTDTLRNAIIGSVAGFTIVSVPGVSEDFALAFHKSAFGFACVAPAVPAGATFGSSQTSDELAMRWLRDYDPNYLRDRSVVSAFAGAASVNDARTDADSSGDTDLSNENRRAVKISFTPSS